MQVDTSHSMASLSSDHISPILHAKQVHSSAATVEYEDEFEKANASLQAAWNTVMDQEAYYKASSFYKKVKCLLISWDKDCDDLHTDKEVQPSRNEIGMKLTSAGVRARRCLREHFQIQGYSKIIDQQDGQASSSAAHEIHRRLFVLRR